MKTTRARINVWGNSLALRLTKSVAAVAGMAQGTTVRIVAQPGRIVIETARRPTLDEMLAAFDPKMHGQAGEVMAFAPVGQEAR
jgi:antitoxin MazE